MKTRTLALFAALLATVAARSAPAVSGNDMLMGARDCGDVCGDEAVAVYGRDLTVYAGSGDVILQFQRRQLDEADNAEGATVHNVLGEEIPATSLSENVIVRLSIDGATRTGDETGDTAADLPRAGGLGDDHWQHRDPRYWVPEIPATERLWHQDVYPGIDFWYFDDTSRSEFDFLSRSGSSWSEITLRVDGTEPSTVDAEGNLVFMLQAGKLVIGRPRIYQSLPSPAAVDTTEHADSADLREFEGTYEGGGNVVRFTADPATPDVPVGYNGTKARPEPELRLVSASGDTNAPAYDYYLGRFEVRNIEFVDFLNSAEANATNLLGTNLTFDAQGNVWINPAMKSGRDEAFSVADSRIVYTPDRKPGERYSISTRQPAFGGSYTNHPVTGLSWFGAVKYCNWLTLTTGRGTDQRCYREGTNAWDWAPVSCAVTNWKAGVFTTGERRAWLNVRGFRLPMDNCSGTNGTGNAFSELYKAATWTGTTNVPYGFGRTNVFAGDANYRQPNAAGKPDTMPVGFYDGSDHDGTFPTRTNDNAYGIYDLSGNVEEWVNDPGITNSSIFRGVYGGSWMQALPEMSSRRYARPSETRGSRGLRLSSSYSADSSLFIMRIPFYACLCPYQRVSTKEADEAARKAAEEAAKVPDRKWNVLETDPKETTGIPEGVIRKKETTTEEISPPTEGGGVPEEGGGVPGEEGGGEVSPI